MLCGQVFISLSRVPAPESRIDLQWEDVRNNLVVVANGVAANRAKGFSMWPLAAYYTGANWMVPQTFNLLPLDDTTYTGALLLIDWND